MHADVIRLKVNAMHVPDVLCSVILFFYRKYVQNI